MPYYWNILKPGTNGGGLVAWWEESWVLIVFKSWKHWSIEQCKHCTWRWFETNALVSCRSGLSLPHSLFSLDALLHLARSTPRWCHHFSSWSISKRSVYTFPLAPFTYHCNRTGLGFLFGAIANHRLESVEKYQHEVRAWEEPPGFFVLGKFGSLEMHKK